MQVAPRARLFDDDDDDDDVGGVATRDTEDDTPREEYRREYPNKLFVQETLEAFPDAGVADVEQARVRRGGGDMPCAVWVLFSAG